MYKVLDIDHSNDVITQEQSVVALKQLGAEEDILFFKIMEKVRFFPKGRGELLDTFKQIVSHKKSQFWDEEFPNFSERFLQLSSIEGEGSYFYEISSDHVYDVDWDDMELLISGEFNPTWETYQQFLEWYYGDEF